MAEGDHSEYSSQDTEIWKGRYNNEVVALRILRVHQYGSRAQRTKSVSGVSGLQGGMSRVNILTDDIAVLQRSSIDDAAQARQHYPILWGIEDGL